MYVFLYLVVYLFVSLNVSRRIVLVCSNIVRKSGGPYILWIWIRPPRVSTILWQWVSGGRGIFLAWLLVYMLILADLVNWGWWVLFCLVADIRELINLDDVMEELGLGPNGGLMYCMEYPFPICRTFLWVSCMLLLSAFACDRCLC